MPPTIELKLLQARVAQLAANLHAAESQLGNIRTRLEAIEEALQLKDEANKAQDITPTPKRKRG